MEKALAFLFKNDSLNLDDNLLFWVILGPLSLIVTVFVCMLEGSNAAMLISSLSLISLPLCWKLKRWGVIVSLLMLLVIYLGIVLNSPQNSLWFFGACFSISIGICITMLAFEEASKVISEVLSAKEEALSLCEKHRSSLNDLEKERLKEKQSHEEFLELLNTEKLELTDKLQSEEKLIDVLKKEYHIAFEEKTQVLEEAQNLRKIVKGFKMDSEERIIPHSPIDSNEDLELELKLRDQEIDRLYQRMREQEGEMQQEFEANLQEKTSDLQEKYAKEKATSDLRLKTLNETRCKALEGRLSAKSKEKEKLTLINENHTLEIRELEDKIVSLIKSKDELLQKESIKWRSQIDLEKAQITKKHLQETQGLKEQAASLLEEKELCFQSELIEQQSQIDLEKAQITKKHLQETQELKEQTASLLEEKELCFQSELIEQQSQIDLEKAQISDLKNLEIQNLKEKVSNLIDDKELVCQDESIKWQSQIELEKIQVEGLQKQVIDLKKFAGLYNQLREQFQEKSQLAHSLRQETFHHESLQLAAEKDLEQGIFEINEEYEHFFLKDISPALKDLREKEEEIQQLQGLVTTLATSLAS
jgi:hypothetical protein